MTLSLIDDTKMTNIANAIRTKGGTSASLTPDEMVTAIANIPSGGTDYLEQRLKNTLTTYTIPNGVTSIPKYLFYGCSNLTNIIMPNITYIGEGAFSYCSGLTNIEIPNGVTNIQENTFAGCYGLTNIIIPSSITNIGSMAFYGCSSLTSITIPNSVATIGGQAFRGCSSLTDVTIGSGITRISSVMAFDIATSTNKATIKILATTPPTISGDTFSLFKLNKIIVPQGTLSTYQNANNWSNFASVMEEATE